MLHYGVDDVIELKAMMDTVRHILSIVYFVALSCAFVCQFVADTAADTDNRDDVRHITHSLRALLVLLSFTLDQTRDANGPGPRYIPDTF